MAHFHGLALCRLHGHGPRGLAACTHLSLRSVRPGYASARHRPLIGPRGCLPIARPCVCRLPDRDPVHVSGHTVYLWALRGPTCSLICLCLWSDYVQVESRPCCNPPSPILASPPPSRSHDQAASSPASSWGLSGAG